MTDLYTRSIEIILENQSASGAYIASPNFANYRYSWFRDGAFTAYAMDLVGQQESAHRFHQWAANVINAQEDIVGSVLEGDYGIDNLPPEKILHTRYTLDGQVGDEDWPNFQLDGFGTWLWSLGEHKKLHGGDLPKDWLKAADLVSKYLLKLWRLPCYDCWEEFPDKVHPYTLSAIYAGIQSMAEFGRMDEQNVLAEIKDLILSAGTTNGHLNKFLGSGLVDASLLGLAVPYSVLSPDDPIMIATVTKIEEDLRVSGGVRRYSEDTYYGGGEWLLLEAWLGWYYLRTGDLERARRSLTWIAAQADSAWNLPEQVPKNLNENDYYQRWVKRWGEIANPLVWSHAKYLILHHLLKR